MSVREVMLLKKIKQQQQQLKGTSPLRKIRYLTGQESTQAALGTDGRR